MTKRAPKPLPPPTMEEREAARAAASALRAAIADSTMMGVGTVVHIDLSHPRRGQWWKTWPGLPGFTRVQCSREGLFYMHSCLPGWTYKKAEILAEMIPDLEALAERGERPKEETR